MVNKDISGAVVLQIGNLQAVGGADFSRLEGGVHAVDLHYRFGFSGLQKGSGCFNDLIINWNVKIPKVYTGMHFFLKKKLTYYSHHAC